MSDNETSSRRAEANRKNAQKSTGPRTAEGKARSRFNAVKHGMRAATPVLPGEDKAAFDDRLERWTRNLAPRDDVEQFLVKRAVELSWQLERADRAIALSRQPAEERIAAVLDEVLALGRRLFWDPRGPSGLYPQVTEYDGMIRRISWSGEIDDPDDPARLVNRLEATAAGCGWMLDRWAELQRGAGGRPVVAGARPLQGGAAAGEAAAGLRDRLADHDDLFRQRGDEPEGAAGVQGPGRGDDAGAEEDLRRAGQRRLVEGVRPSDPEGGKAALLELIAEEEERLEELLAGHLERTEPTVGESFDATDAGERLRRYQASCDRGLLRVLEAIRKRQREADRARASSSKAAKPSKPDEKDQKDQWKLIGRVLDVMAEARAAKGTSRAADPLASVGAKAAAADAPRSATIEPKPVPPATPASDDRSRRPRGRAGLLGIRPRAPRPGRRTVRGRSRATEANRVGGTNERSCSVRGTRPHEKGVGPRYPHDGPALGVRPPLGLVP